MDDDPFDEFERISQDRQFKDYWNFARALSRSARDLKDNYSNWLAAEFKELRYYCDILAPNTNGSIRDKIQKAQPRLIELENDSIKLLMRVENFVKRIENQGTLEAMQLPMLLDEYKRVLEPIEQLIVRDLFALRTSLQDVLDTIRSENVITIQESGPDRTKVGAVGEVPQPFVPIDYTCSKCGYIHSENSKCPSQSD